MANIDIQVPDIGDFDEVAVIELLVKVGDTVAVDQSLITVESDKASMEIPSSHAGVVTALKVKMGDKVKQGSVIVSIDSVIASEAKQSEAASASSLAVTNDVMAPPVIASEAKQSPVIATAAPSGLAVTKEKQSETAAPSGHAVASEPRDFDLLVLGSGPGGYSAAFRAADLGLKVAIVERYAQLGGVCLNVGCIPSKALLHVAAVMDEVSHLADIGVDYGKPKLNIDNLRGHKEKVIGKLTGGLAAMAKMRKVTVLRGYGVFVDSHHVSVEETTGTAQDKTGKTQVVSFKTCIIAAGSQAVHLPFMQKDGLDKDPRVVDSTGALQLAKVPKRMLVLGGGIIGLEMGTVYSTLGARLDVVEMMDGLMQGADRDLVKVWQKMNAPRFDKIMLKTKTVSARAMAKGIEVTFEGEGAPAPQVYDLVLQAVGRTPNGKKCGADKAGVDVTERGFINVDKRMRTNVPHIFAIGDVVGQPMLAHKAVHEGHVAAEVIAGELQDKHELACTVFDARVIPSVAYTDPEVAWVGLTEDQAKAQGIKVKKGLFPWTASGRAIANGRFDALTKLLFDDSPEPPG